uniref:Uncharacterized protein n=1 Tax=Opuntia streptacantha TaxID=393608 RepID=A0A7C9AF86_OPUST
MAKLDPPEAEASSHKPQVWCLQQNGQNLQYFQEPDDFSRDQGETWHKLVIFLYKEQSAHLWTISLQASFFPSKIADFSMEVGLHIHSKMALQRTSQPFLHAYHALLYYLSDDSAISDSLLKTHLLQQ